jgi:hypothetical protein
VPGFRDPATGGVAFVDPVTGAPARHRLVVHSHDPAGFSDTAYLGRRIGGPTSGFVLDAEGRRVVDLVVAPQTSAVISFEYVAGVGEWRLVTYFPES